eukprot:1434595-Rhodomonas_salina.1
MFVFTETERCVQVERRTARPSPRSALSETNRLNRASTAPFRQSMVETPNLSCNALVLQSLIPTWFTLLPGVQYKIPGTELVYGGTRTRGAYVERDETIHQHMAVFALSQMRCGLSGTDIAYDASADQAN